MANPKYPVHVFVGYQIDQIPGLSDESRSDFQSLFSFLCDDLKTSSVIEQMCILTFVSCKFQEIAANNQWSALRDSMRMPAIKNVFTKLDYEGQASTPEIEADVAANALRYKTSYAFEQETCDRLEAAGHTRDAVERETVRLTLEHAFTSERLLLSTARRSLMALNAIAAAKKLMKK